MIPVRLFAPVTVKLFGPFLQIIRYIQKHDFHKSNEQQQQHKMEFVFFSLLFACSLISNSRSILEAKAKTK